jgi:serine phosphatase RsbU (regulator of sigma subunit)
MEHDPTPDDVLPYAFRLDTLFEISRSLFTSFDVEEILKLCLLSTMGNFGVLRGFVTVFDLPSGRMLHFVSKGCREGEVDRLKQAAAARLGDFAFEKAHLLGCSEDDPFQAAAAIDCVLPFMIDPKRAGWLAIGSRILGGGFSEDEKKVLVTLKNNLVVALQNAGSFEEIRRLNADLTGKKKELEKTVLELEEALEKVAEYSRHLEKIIAALNVAQEVQQNLLPQGPPVEKRLDVAGRSFYCDETGGDYYDYIALPCLGPDACALVVGDVSGHGISSALLMAGVRAYLRGRAGQPGSAAEIVTDVNRLVAADTANTFQFMTLFFLVVDAASGALSWVNAGHDPVFLYDRSADRFEELKGKGVPLGVQPDWRYTEHRARIRPGQVLVLTTDGTWEAHNATGELFGKERFKDAIRASAGLPADGILQAVLSAVEGFRGAAPQHDDITLVVAKRQPTD